MSAHAGRRTLSTQPKGHSTAMAAASHELEPMPVPEISKEEYKDMVNTYGLPSDMWDQPAFGMQGQSRKRRQRYPLAPRLVVTAEEESKPPYTEREVLEPEDDEHAQQLDKMLRLLKRPLGTVSHNALWKAYRKLRAPRLRYMNDYMIRTLFGHLTWTEHAYKSDRTRQRYFALLEECVGEEVPLTVVEWSAAMHYAGRAARKGTDHEVKDAVELWLKMEDSGVKANNVTFNILFYVAVKAGRYALADTIYNELKTRNMELDRYFRVSMIYYAGTRGEGDSVRKAFNDMVEAGEIVDTAVMNCVMLSLIKSGEPSAADHVFRKMKALHESKFGTKGPTDWRGQRKLAKLLNETGHTLRAERQAHEKSFFGAPFSGNDRREQIQEASPIAPNAQTYRILLRHHAQVSGELDRLQELMAEHKESGLHVHGSVYLGIFSGFIVHGGYAHSDWKPRILEAYWQEFLDASSAPNAGYWLTSGTETNQTLHFDAADTHEEDDPFTDPESLMAMEEDDPGLLSASEEHKPPYFTLNMAVTVLRAFHKCMGTPRMLEVWSEIRARWKECGREETEKLETLVEKLQKRDL